jgi:hypothetical protein
VPSTNTAIEQPYGLIWSSWKDGRVVSFLGADASFVGRPPGTDFNCEKPAFLPSGYDLSCCLAGDVEFPGDKGYLAGVCSYLRGLVPGFISI